MWPVVTWEINDCLFPILKKLFYFLFLFLFLYIIVIFLFCAYYSINEKYKTISFTMRRIIIFVLPKLLQGLHMESERHMGWRHEAPIDESVMCYVLYICEFGFV